MEGGRRRRREDMSSAAERRARFVEGRRDTVDGGMVWRVWKKDVDASRREIR